VRPADQEAEAASSDKGSRSTPSQGGHEGVPAGRGWGLGKAAAAMAGLENGTRVCRNNLDNSLVSCEKVLYPIPYSLNDLDATLVCACCLRASYHAAAPRSDCDVTPSSAKTSSIGACWRSLWVPFTSPGI